MLVAVGVNRANHGTVGALRRFNTDGSVDPAFGAQGVATAALVQGENTFLAKGIVDSDDNLVAVGGDGLGGIVDRVLSAGGGVPPSNHAYLGKPGDGTNATFIQNLYEELLGRPPDAAGQAYWLALLNDDNYTTLEVVRLFQKSTEYQNDVVQSFYQTFLHRQPDPTGLAYWTGLLADGTSQEALIAGIVGSPKYYQDQGSSDGGFVTAIYRDLLGREPDAEGRTYWIAQTDQAIAGNSSATALDPVVVGMLNSAEFRGDVLGEPSALSPVPGNGWNQAFFNGRLTGHEQAQFSAELAAKVPWEDIVDEMLASTAFFNAAG